MQDVGHPVYFIIDAFDQCSKLSQVQLWDAISSILVVTGATFKVLITCLPLIELLDLAEDSLQIHIKPEDVADDIRATMALEARKVAYQLGLLPSLEEEALMCAVAKSDGMFRCASQVMDEFRQALSVQELITMLRDYGAPNVGMLTESSSDSGYPHGSDTENTSVVGDSGYNDEWSEDGKSSTRKRRESKLPLFRQVPNITNSFQIAL
jgi:hypothetical protein